MRRSDGRRFLTARGRRGRLLAAGGGLLLLGACATADDTVATYDRGQHRAAQPVLKGEQLIEDAGARITGTEPAYKQGGTFFVSPDNDKTSFGAP